MKTQKYDIIIIGAGAIGFAFALSIKNYVNKILIIDKVKEKTLKNPDYDGRETAITHNSSQILKNLNIWQKFKKDEISLIKNAKVLNGLSDYSLNFSNDITDKENLGFLLSNHLIKKYSFLEIKNNFEKIELRTDISVLNIDNNNDLAEITLSDGSVLETELLIAADGRFSYVRKKVAIATDMKDFGKTMITCKIKHKKDNEAIALECFDYDRGLAILPLSKNISSLVMTISSNLVDKFINMSDQEFNKNISERFFLALGNIEIISKKYVYPLISTYAQKFIAKNVVLLGDAAIGMHPVTAHGFNLGLKGQDILTKEIKLAISKNQSFADQKVLEKYNSKYQKEAQLLYYGTNAIVSLFTNDNFHSKILRNLSLKIANNPFIPFKTIVTKKLTKIC